MGFDFNKQVLRDIFEWDVTNWSKSLAVWEKYLSFPGQHCLELGARSGGLSLLLSLNGHNVICSDIENPIHTASKIHSKYINTLHGDIKYQAIDATNIPYDEEFDIVIFKSILGGIGSYGKNDLQLLALENIHKSLKPGGVLLFAENLSGSKIHAIFRKKFIKWGKRWNYLNYQDIDYMFDNYSELEYSAFGVLGTFGRNEGQRNILGIMDHYLDYAFPPNSKYIVFGAARK